MRWTSSGASLAPWRPRESYHQEKRSERAAEEDCAGEPGRVPPRKRGFASRRSPSPRSQPDSREADPRAEVKKPSEQLRRGVAKEQLRERSTRAEENRGDERKADVTPLALLGANHASIHPVPGAAVTAPGR
jgi:hypothetical protein